MSASFAYGTAVIALISAGDATDAVWEKRAGGIGTPVAAEMFAGPYAITGSFLSADGTMSVLVNDRVGVRDATFTRIDGAGDGQPITAQRALVATGLVQAAVASST
jgi:hypothetical protein